MDIGLDFAWSKPSIDALHAFGASFVMGYLSHDASKNLTVDYARAALAAGIDVGLFFEDEVNGTLNGYTHGVADGEYARAQAIELGYPQGACIYFAVDFDTTESQQHVIDQYMYGVIVGIDSHYAVGIYGGYYVVKRVLDANIVSYACQTYAWSGEQWDARAQLRQVQNGITVGGVDCDKDERHAPAGLWLASGESDNDMTDLTTPAARDAWNAANLAQCIVGLIDDPMMLNRTTISMDGIPVPNGNVLATTLHDLSTAIDRLESKIDQILSTVRQPFVITMSAADRDAVVTALLAVLTPAMQNPDITALTTAVVGLHDAMQTVIDNINALITRLHNTGMALTS
jgi:hypothetical protein